MSDPFAVPSKFHELLSFFNVALAIVIVAAGLIFMNHGRDVTLVLVIAPIWGLLWLLKGLKERNRRLQKEAEVQRLKAGLLETH